MFTSNKIAKKVNEVIKKRIEAAQAQYDGECDALDTAHDEEVKRLHEEKEGKKEALAETLVEKVLFGK